MSSGSRLAPDLVLLGLGLALLLVPAYSSPRPTPRVELLQLALRPLRIDINRAAWFEWALLDGIGAARARRICDDRRRHGPFHSIEDLRRIPDLPSGWVERARPRLEMSPVERSSLTATRQSST